MTAMSVDVAVLPGQKLVTIAAEDRDSLLATVANLLEGNRLLRTKLQRYRDRYGDTRTKRQVAANLRLGLL